MVGMSLLFPGACARIVDEDPAGPRSRPGLLRPLPQDEGEVVGALAVGTTVQILYGPRPAGSARGSTTWWAVRVLTGRFQDRVGWMAEMAADAEYYGLREVRCPAGLL